MKNITNKIIGYAAFGPQDFKVYDTEEEAAKHGIPFPVVHVEEIKL